MTNQKSGVIERTTALMNYCVMACEEPTFNAHMVTRMFKTNNGLFYNAVKLGYFERLGRSSYRFRHDQFTVSMVMKLVEFTARKQKITTDLSRAKRKASKITYPPDAPLVFTIPEPYNVYGYPPHVLIAELKRVGFKGKLTNPNEVEL